MIHDAHKKILIIGSGSAGRRHALSFRELLPTAEIYLLKRSASKQPLEVVRQNGIRIISNLEDLRLSRFNVAVIASPANMHRADAISASRLTNALLIEKPLTSSLKDAIVLQQTLNEKDNQIGVGYHLRFSESLTGLQEIFSNIESGPILEADLVYSQDLSLWRKGVDPIHSVTARSDLGGGVLLELSHEIDALQLLAGPIKHVLTSALRFDGAPTDGEVETLVTFNGICKSNTRFKIHLDMLGNPPIRMWKFKFNNSIVRINLLSGEIFRSEGNKRFVKTFIARQDDRDFAEKNLLSSFISSNKTQSLRLCSLPEAISVLRVIEAVRISFLRKQQEIVKDN